MARPEFAGFLRRSYEILQVKATKNPHSIRQINGFNVVQAELIPLITHRSSTRDMPCDGGKNGEIRAIWASESKIISVVIALAWCRQ